MTNSMFNFKGIALAISFIVFFSYCSSSLFSQTVTQQSDCFGTRVTAVTDGTRCNTNTNDLCGHNAFDEDVCAACVDVTICMDSCSGIDPTEISVSSESLYDCHSVCSPNGDFHNCSDCLPGDRHDTCGYFQERVLVYNGMGGIPDNHCASFRICRNSKGTDDGSQQTYDIAILLPANAHCGSTQCRVAKVKF